MYDNTSHSASKSLTQFAPTVGVSLTGVVCLVALFLPGLPDVYRQVLIIGCVGFHVLAVFYLTQQSKRIIRGIRESLGNLVTQLRKQGVETLNTTIPSEIASTGCGDKYKSLCDEIQKMQAEFIHLKQQCASAEVRSQRYSLALQRLNDLMDIVPDPILLLDPLGRIQSCNRAAQIRLGIHEPQAGPDGSCDESDLFRDLYEQVKRAPSSNTAFDWYVSLSNDHKTHYRVLVRDVGPLENGNRPEHSRERAIFLQDLTPLDELRKRHAEFLSAASHEMKAPLAAIRAYTELLLDGEATDESTREEFISTIETQAQRLQRLVENLLNIARIEAGIMKVHKQAISVNEILQEAGRLMTAAASEKNITLTLDLSPLYLPINADRDLMLQAVINLISNAIKYTPNNGKVTVKSHLRDEMIVIEVEDTGVGMSPSDAQRVFEKFYRVEAHKHMAPGTGLGLSLTKHIVEDVHGGTISLRSELNVGSVFSIALPKASSRTNSPYPVSEPVVV